MILDVCRGDVCKLNSSTRACRQGLRGSTTSWAGGLPAKRVYLIEGDPGSGKTTLGLQFLLEGIAQRREGAVRHPVRDAGRSSPRSRRRTAGASTGWRSTSWRPSDESFKPDDQYTFFHPSEVELSETTKAVLAEVERINPTRVVFDSLSEMRLLAREPLRYRRQILGLKQFFIGRNCTVLLLDDRTSQDGDLQLQSLAHGVITLEQLAPEYGAERRRLRVVKMRGVRFQGGFHDFVIATGGLRVFPRLVAAESRADDSHGTAEHRHRPSSTRCSAAGSIAAPRRCSSVRPAPASRRSRRRSPSPRPTAASTSPMYLFDEGLETFRRRAAGLGADVTDHVASGRIVLTQVDPAEMSPGEFADRDPHARSKRIARRSWSSTA